MSRVTHLYFELERGELKSGLFANRSIGHVETNIDGESWGFFIIGHIGSFHFRVFHWDNTHR